MTGRVYRNALIDALHSIYKEEVNPEATQSELNIYVKQECPMIGRKNPFAYDIDAIRTWVHSRGRNVNIQKKFYEYLVEAKNSRLIIPDPPPNSPEEVGVVEEEDMGIVDRVQRMNIKTYEDLKYFGKIEKCPECNRELFYYTNATTGKKITECAYTKTMIDYNKNRGWFTKESNGQECYWKVEE